MTRRPCVNLLLTVALTRFMIRRAPPFRTKLQRMTVPPSSRVLQRQCFWRGCDERVECASVGDGDVAADPPAEVVGFRLAGLPTASGRR